MQAQTQTRVFALLLITPVLGHFFPFYYEVLGWTITPRELAYFLVAAFAFATALTDGELGFTDSDLGLLVVLIVLIASVSWSPSPYESLRRAVDIMSMAIYYTSVILYLGRDDALRELLRAILLLSVIWTGYGLIELAFGDLTLGLVEYISRNELSRNLLALLPFAALTALWGDRWRASAFGTVTASMVLLIPLSGSRGGIVGLFAVLVVLALLYLRFIHNLSFWQILPAGASAVIIVALGVVAAVHLGVFPQRLTNIPLTAGAFSPEILGPQRYRVHSAELETIRRHWLTGVGYEGFVVLSEETYGIGTFRAHNLITRVWMAAGIGPVIVLVVTGVLILRNYIQAVLYMDGAEQLYVSAFFIGLVGITLAGMFNIVIDEPLWYIFLGVGSNWIPRRFNGY